MISKTPQEEVSRVSTCCADELYRHMKQAGAERMGESGMLMNPFTGQWSFTTDKAVNYIMSFRKPPGG